VDPIAVAQATTMIEIIRIMICEILTANASRIARAPEPI
jgi:hypothetical protein